MSRIPAALVLTLLACGSERGVADIGPVDAVSRVEVSDSKSIDADIAIVEELQTREVETAPPVAQLVWEAVEAGCTEETLAALAEAKAGEVREALLQLDMELKDSHWPPGLSHGHPIKVAFEVDALADFEFDYDLFIPPGYTGDPHNRFPVYVNPAHPTSDLEDDLTLPWLSSMAEDRFVLITVNFMNRLYTELPDAQYDAIFDDETAAYHDYFSTIEAALSDVHRRLWTDPSKVYIGGVSAMGASAWFSGIFLPDQFAALNPYSIIPAPFDDELLRNLSHVGVLVVHGTADEITPVEYVPPRVDKLTGWGFDVEYWELEGEGHGTMFSKVFPDAVNWMLQRSRPVLPETVHRGVKSPRAAGAYWLEATAFSVPLPAGANIYPSSAPAVVDATWGKGALDIEATGVSTLEARWKAGPPGPASGAEGDSVSLTVNGADLGAVTLEQDPTVAVEDYCRHSDISRIWTGRVVVEVP